MLKKAVLLVALMGATLVTASKVYAQQPPGTFCMGVCRYDCNGQYGNNWINCMADCLTNICWF